MALIGFLKLKPASVRAKPAAFAGTLPARRSSKTSPFPLGWILSLFVAITLVSLQHQENRHTLQLQQMMVNITSPLLKWAEKPVQFISAVMLYFSDHHQLTLENAALKVQNQYLLRRQHQYQHSIVENLQLRQALNVAKALEPFHTIARVVGHSYNGASSSLIVNTQGLEQIEKDSPVLSTCGSLLGRVISDQTSTARVMLLTDVNSRIPVQLEDTREHAIIAGDNSAHLRLTHLEKSTKIKVGTRLLTSAFGGVFPAGIPVAEVISVEGDLIKAKPCAQFNNLDYVLLLS